MNWKSTGIAGAVGATLFLVWFAIALSTVAGAYLWVCILCALLGAILTGAVAFQRDAAGTWPPMTVTLPAGLLGAALPLLAILLGISDGGGEPQPPRQPPDQPAGAMHNLLSGTRQDWEAGFQHAYQRGARETKTVPDSPGQPQRAQQRPVSVEPDGSGGGRVTVSVPAANFVATGLTFRRGEAFYISTPHYVPNLQVGIIKEVGGVRVFVWAPVPANELWSPGEPHRMRLDSAAEAELCFGTAAVPPGTYRINVGKSAGPVGPAEYTPGVSLGRLLY